MNLKIFKEKYPALFWRSGNLTIKELLINIIQLENKSALKEFINQIWFDKVKKLFFEVRWNFETSPSLILRWQKMYNWFIFYKKKKLGTIKDMRKYRFWWTKTI